MFENVRSLIDSRLGQNIVEDDFASDDGFFLKIPAKELYSVAFFLKNDPDVRLTMFDQIVALRSRVLPWKTTERKNDTLEILYQLRSLKLPYRVTLVIEISVDMPIMSIAPLYAGSRFLEKDLSDAYGLSFDEAERR